MLQIAVCDDEKLYLNEVLKILHETLDGTPNKIQTFQNSAALIAAVEEDGYIPDIAVLDICMDGVDGITLAKQLNKASPTSKIIFISSYSGYLMDVYETEHVYFVLKPNMEERLPAALQKALASTATIKTLSVKSGAYHQRVRLDNVLCIERLKHKTIVHTDNGDIETTQFPKTLIDSGGVQADFIRCHQSFWVCAKAIAAMEREQFKLRDGSFVPISRTYRNESRRAFFDLLAGTVKQEIKA